MVVVNMVEVVDKPGGDEDGVDEVVDDPAGDEEGIVDVVVVDGDEVGLRDELLDAVL